MKYLSVCAILKNERKYLKEWVEFYLKQGVEHFYLYDNDSEDGPREVLADYDEFITWHWLPGKAKQREAYNHCIENYKNATVWCAFLDLDEFLYSGKDKKFRYTLAGYYDSMQISGVAVRWLLFGSSGYVFYDPTPVTKRFIKRAKAVNGHCKSIMRLKDTHCVGNNVHTFRASELIVDEHGNVMPREYAIMDPATADILRINHYHTKSYGEYQKKRLLPKADSGQMVDFEENFKIHDCNELEDKRIWEVL